MNRRQFLLGSGSALAAAAVLPAVAPAINWMGIDWSLARDRRSTWTYTRAEWEHEAGGFLVPDEYLESLDRTFMGDTVKGWIQEIGMNDMSRVEFGPGLDILFDSGPPISGEPLGIMNRPGNTSGELNRESFKRGMELLINGYRGGRKAITDRVLLDIPSETSDA